MAVLSAAAITAADARHRQGIIVCNLRGCSNQSETTAVEPSRVRVVSYSDGEVVGHRSAGCPHEFCGCEASLYLFGHVRPDLNLASNWIRKFPRTAPAPGMVAARSGHVMVLIRHVSGNDWLVHDGNSGGGLTRDHIRSIRGYVIVDPQETMLAARTKQTEIASAPTREKHETPTHVASATDDRRSPGAEAPVALPKPRPIEAAVEDTATTSTKRVEVVMVVPKPRPIAAMIEEMTTASLKRDVIPHEWMASVPIGHMRSAPVEHVAATLVERWSVLQSTPVRIDGPTPVKVEHIAAVPAEAAPTSPMRAGAAEQAALIAIDRVPLPPARRPVVEVERTAAIPIDQVPVPPVRAISAPAEQIAAIPIEQVPLPRERQSVIAPEQVASIPLEDVPLPRARMASITPEQVAVIPLDHVPLPRQRPVSVASAQVASIMPLDDVSLPTVRASVGLPETAMIPSDDVPLPRARLASRPPEAPAAEPAAGPQFMQAASIVEHTPAPSEQVVPVSNVQEAPHAHAAHWRHGRHNEPSLVKRAASVVEEALTSVRKVFRTHNTHKSRRGNWS